MHRWMKNMRRCIARRDGINSRCFTGSSRSLLGPQSGKEAIGPSRNDQTIAHGLSSTQRVTQDRTGASSVVENGSTDQGTRQERRPLPLSPLMDPAYIAAKQKHHLPKAPASRHKELTPFQKLLAKNPYARALATPIRRCQLSGVTIPRFFLQDFELVTHPETKDLWFLPRSLTSPHSTATETSVPDLPDSGTKYGPKVYFLSRAALLHGTTVRGSGIFDAARRCVPVRIREVESSLTKRVQWRTDVAQFVLELMRRRVVEDLLWSSERNRGYLAKCQGMVDATTRKQVGAVLWLGDSVEEVVEVKAMEEENITTVSGPGEFATLDIPDKERKSKIPVHNLLRLIGKKHIEHLRRRASKTFSANVVVLKHKNSTIDLQMKLWKLQGYLAEYRDLQNVDSSV